MAKKTLPSPGLLRTPTDRHAITNLVEAAREVKDKGTFLHRPLDPDPRPRRVHAGL